MILRLVLCAIALVAAGLRADAQMVGGVELPQIDWEQKLGAQVPLDARFTDENGTELALSDLVSERPVVLALVYYECPMLCNLVLNGLVRALRAVSFDAGSDFDVIAISIDPAEGFEMGAERKASLLERYGRANANAGWKFLVGDEASIRSVADAVGFQYAYVESTDEYAHAAGVTVMTPDGRASRYFYGHEFSARDLRLGLVEAGEGSIGSPVDKILLRCFQYDPSKGQYGFAIMSTIRLAGIATVALLGLFVLRSLRSERRRGAAPPSPRTEGTGTA